HAEGLLYESPLVFPLSICGDGAKKLALKYDIGIVEEKSLITRASFNRYKKCLKKMNGSKPGEEIAGRDIMASDTVGCLVVNSSGSTVAACSSGGILFKKPGRLGPAAFYGCACWAEDADDLSITITVSGCGETLIKTHFARSCAEFIFQKLREDENSCLMDIVQNFFKIRYLESRLLNEFDTCRKTAGFIVVVCQKCKTNVETENNISDLLIELAYVHNSEEMVIGYGLRRKNGETKLQSFSSKSENGKVDLSLNDVGFEV
uniref:Threonine aspartase n=1 Tax=Romanomermis culicivorax TaxID=13658 RepID=A0A915IT66_ROMCU